MDQQTLFSEPVGVLAVIIMIPVFFVWLERKTGWKVFNFLPAIIWIFLTPIFLSNLDIIPRSTPIYDNFKSWAVPMVIVLMLLGINIRESLKVAWRGVGVLVLGAVGIVVGACIAFYMFRHGLGPNAWSGFGALAGSWIGGTGNLAAVAEGLQTPAEMVGIVVIVDNFVYLPYFPLIIGCKRWAARFNRFSRVSEEQMQRIAASAGVVSKRTSEIHFRDLLTLLGWAFTAILAAKTLASVMPAFPPVLTEKTWAMLLVTTIGIGMSASPLRKVPGSEQLAMTLIYIYMTMLGASADLRNIGGAVWFLAAGVICIIVHLIFVVLAARLFRVDISMAAVASVASVGGAASAPVAASFHRDDLVPISIMLALIGYGLGNYLGVATAYLCHMLA
jgi:uncharacterized membrane protein